jgi:hypothetical protein
MATLYLAYDEPTTGWPIGIDDGSEHFILGNWIDS